jgi:hypothetical protein
MTLLNDIVCVAGTNKFFVDTVRFGQSNQSVARFVEYMRALLRRQHDVVVAASGAETHKPLEVSDRTRICSDSRWVSDVV